MLESRVINLLFIKMFNLKRLEGLGLLIFKNCLREATFYVRDSIFFHIENIKGIPHSFIVETHT